MKSIEVYRKDAADADKERRRRRARLSYDEKLAILQKLRRVAEVIPKTMQPLKTGFPLSRE